MQDNLSPEHYREEIAALNHEIYRLSQRIEQQEHERLFSPAVKSDDPFNNPTEYHEFSRDYSDILPEMNAPGAEIPLEPERGERRRIRRSYSIGGWCLLFQFVISNTLALALIFLIRNILTSVNPDWSTAQISSYIRGSSLLMGINLIIYIAANVICALIGMKWSRTDYPELIHTRDFSFGKAAAYCMIALFLRTAAAYAASGAEAIVSKFGHTTNTLNTDGMAETGFGTALMILYTCLIAPITEELLFRGMLLRTFSRANQRFAIFATAFFFGLVHGNIPQFLLGFILGIFLAHITLKHGSIFPAVIVHMFMNTFVQLMSFISDHADDTEFLIFSLSLMLLNITGFITLLYFRSEDKLPATTPAQTRRGISVALTSPAFLAALVLFIGQIVLNLLDVTL